jgi:hypothetical protein
MQVGSEKAAYKHPRSDSTSPRSSGSSAQACARNASTLANRLLHGGVVARLDLFPGVRVHMKSVLFSLWFETAQARNMTLWTKDGDIVD